MYELLIIALLLHWPLNGYRIAKIMNDIIGPITKVSFGTLYPLLSKLEQNHLIASTEEEEGQATRKGRQQRTYHITPAGRERFHQLMMDTTSNQGEYQKFFRIKVLHLEFLQPEERLYLLDHYIRYCQIHIHFIDVERKDLDHDPTVTPNMSTMFRENSLSLMKHLSSQWQGELNWATNLRNTIVTKAPLP